MRHLFIKEVLGSVHGSANRMPWFVLWERLDYHRLSSWPYNISTGESEKPDSYWISSSLFVYSWSEPVKTICDKWKYKLKIWKSKSREVKIKFFQGFDFWLPSRFLLGQQQKGYYKCHCLIKFINTVICTTRQYFCLSKSTIIAARKYIISFLLWVYSWVTLKIYFGIYSVLKPLDIRSGASKLCLNNLH